MISDAWVVAPLLLAGVLAVSGSTKLGSAEQTLASMASLRLPEWLRARWIALVLPWAELALAVALLLTSGSVFVMGSLATLALMGAYLAIVVLAVLRPEPADCGCFGDLVDSRVTWRTVTRNVLLAAAAAVTAAAALLGTSTLATLAALDTDDLWWLAAALGLGGLGFTLGEPARREEPEPPLVAAEDLGDYLRSPIPFARVTTADGTPSTLRALASSQARLLVFLSPTCGACTQVAGALQGWIEALAPAVAVHPVMRQRKELVESFLGDRLQHALFEEEGSASSVFEISGVPAAVLLGADGLVAGGPVTGPNAIEEFVADIRLQLGDV